MHREMIEIEFEVEAAQLAASIAQATQMIGQIDTAFVLRQLADFKTPLTIQLPNLALQTTPKLEDKNG